MKIIYNKFHKFKIPPYCLQLVPAAAPILTLITHFSENANDVSFQFSQLCLVKIQKTLHQWREGFFVSGQMKMKIQRDNGEKNYYNLNIKKLYHFAQFNLKLSHPAVQYALAKASPLLHIRFSSLESSACDFPIQHHVSIIFI